MKCDKEKKMKLMLHQVVLVVKDLELSTQFYSKFGFEPMNRINKKDGRTRVTLIQRDYPNFELKLFSNKCPITENSHLKSKKDIDAFLRTTGIRYFTLLTENINEFYETYNKKIKFLTSPKRGMTGCKYVYIKDPDGILVEIYEKPKN